MLIVICSGFVLGVASQLAWPALPLLPILLAAGLALCVLCLRAVRGWRQCAAGAIGVVLGMSLAVVHARAVLDARLPAAQEGSDFLLSVRINSVTQLADGSQMLQVSATSLPWGIQARWMPDWRLRISSRDGIAATVGESWQLPVRLRRPRAAQNPGSMDFERYLFGERVVATGYLRDDTSLQRLASATGWPAMRATLLASALPLLGDGPGDLADNDADRFARAVLPALILDERQYLASAQWRVLADTGTAHLVAISGLHVALLWGALVGLGGLLLRRRSDTLRYRAAAVLPALALAFFYAALAGMPLPALRATLMLAVASVFLLCNGQVPAWRILLASSVAVLLVDPLSVHASGFWLSFGAVALLLLLNDLRRCAANSVLPAVLRHALAGFGMQVVLTVLLAPMLVGLFGAASISSVLANVPAIPLVNLLALPAGLLGFALAPMAPGFANLLLDGATSVLAYLWIILQYIDGISWLAPLQVFAAGPVHVAALLLLLPLACYVRNGLLRVSIVLAACLFWPVTETLPAGVARACVLDVGQGLAVVIRTNAHAWIYDAGPEWGERDAGATTVVPAARALGIRQLDALVVSHDDADHAGGAASVQRALSPHRVILGDLRSRQRFAGAGERCAAVGRWRLDDVQFTVFPGAAEGNSNDRSCVLRVAAGGRALLLTGDSTRRRELALLDAFGDDLVADVLVAGHHGSDSATALTFLHRVAPQQVIFSAGHRNRFGHPNARVVERVRRQGATMYSTSQSGALCFRLEADEPLHVQGQRTLTRRFWRE